MGFNRRIPAVRQPPSATREVRKLRQILDLCPGIWQRSGDLNTRYKTSTMKAPTCQFSIGTAANPSRTVQPVSAITRVAALALVLSLLTGCISFPQMEEQQQNAAATAEAPQIDPQLVAARKSAAKESRLHAVISLINEIYVGQGKVIFTDDDMIPALETYYAGRDMVFLPVEVIKIDKFGRLVTEEGERGVVVQGRALEAEPTRAVVQLREQTMDADRVSWTNTYIKNEKGDWVVAEDNTPEA
jgi:hypothetical protein